VGIPEVLPARGGEGREFSPDPGYGVSRRYRKRIEEIWGWMKTVGGFGKTCFRELAAYLVGAAYNLVRMAKLVAAWASRPVPNKVPGGTHGVQTPTREPLPCAPYPWILNSLLEELLNNARKRGREFQLT